MSTLTLAAAAVRDAAKTLYEVAGREERRDVQAVALLVMGAAKLATEGVVTTRTLGEIYAQVIVAWVDTNRAEKSTRKAGAR